MYSRVLQLSHDVPFHQEYAELGFAVCALYCPLLPFGGMPPPPPSPPLFICTNCVLLDNVKYRVVF